MKGAVTLAVHGRRVGSYLQQFLYDLETDFSRDAQVIQQRGLVEDITNLHPGPTRDEHGYHASQLEYRAEGSGRIVSAHVEPCVHSLATLPTCCRTNSQFWAVWSRSLRDVSASAIAAT